MTRRLRGDMRLCPRWSAPCAASLESFTASSVSDDEVKALHIKSEFANQRNYGSSIKTLCLVFL